MTAHKKSLMSLGMAGVLFFMFSMVSFSMNSKQTTAKNGTYYDPTHHTLDKNKDYVVNLSELLRGIQFFNSGGYHCASGTEDGYAPGPGTNDCIRHDSDYNPRDGIISLSELLRSIQFFNTGCYHQQPDTEDGFAPGVAPGPYKFSDYEGRIEPFVIQNADYPEDPVGSGLHPCTLWIPTQEALSDYRNNTIFQESPLVDQGIPTAEPGDVVDTDLPPIYVPT